MVIRNEVFRTTSVYATLRRWENEANG